MRPGPCHWAAGYQSICLLSSTREPSPSKRCVICTGVFPRRHRTETERKTLERSRTLDSSGWVKEEGGVGVQGKVMERSVEAWRVWEQLICWRGGGAVLLEVISVDYRGRVQCTAALCNLPPWKIDVAQEWSDTCTYREKQTRGRRACENNLDKPGKWPGVCLLCAHSRTATLIFLLNAFSKSPSPIWWIRQGKPDLVSCFDSNTVLQQPEFGLKNQSAGAKSLIFNRGPPQWESINGRWGIPNWKFNNQIHRGLVTKKFLKRDVQSFLFRWFLKERVSCAVAWIFNIYCVAAALWLFLSTLIAMWVHMEAIKAGFSFWWVKEWVLSLW